MRRTDAFSWRWSFGGTAVYLGVHDPGDVAAGWALAVLALALPDPGPAMLLPA